jgi:ATP-binding cassette subfamily B multidrug efflux pump
MLDFGSARRDNEKNDQVFKGWFMKGIFRTLKILKRYWPTALGGLLCLLLVNAANLYTPQLLGQLIDKGITPMSMDSILRTSGLLVGVAVVRGVFNFLQGYWSEVTSQGIAYELRNRIFRKIQRLSFSYHDQSQTGKLMTRMTSDVELVRQFAGMGILQMIGALILLIGTLIILFKMNWVLTLVFLATIPPIMLIFGQFITKIMPLSKEIQQKLGILNTLLQENLAGIRVVKAFAREDYEISRFNVKNEDFKNQNLKLVQYFSTFFPLVFLFANLAIAGVVWLGGLRVINQTLTLGELVAFISYQGYFLMPIFMLGFIGSSLSRAEASAQRLFEVIDAKSDVKDKPDALVLDDFQGSVIFDNVAFRYFGGEQDVIHDISFEVKPNQTVAILGKTGSGKSSIINLIPRFYDVTNGKVLIDGHDVRDLKLSSLREKIGIVLQETTLFSGSIRENIAYGKPDASFEEIVSAARTARAEDFIKEMPEGFETIIGERGTGLSGGQKQRLAIARALLVNPRILIMDDSTSSVDAQTEYEIQEALEKLRIGRTTFVIAQRISTVRKADMILLLDEGELVGKGTHEELLDCCELYTEILETQFGEHIPQPLESSVEVI